MFLDDVQVLYLYMSCVGCLCVFGVHRLLTLWRYLRGRPESSEPKPLEVGRYPFVTVQLPVYNERYVVARLIQAVAGLDWPRDRLQIQVLDDSTDETTGLAEEAVRQACQQGLDVSLIHRENRQGYKAGALANAMAEVRGEFVAIFDADFVPQPDFLQQVMPRFGEGVGMLQARWGHINRERTVLTRLQAILLDSHFVVEQAARSKHGLWFNFNGTAGVWRVQAIRDAGGWSHDTLTEDLDLSYRAQLAGWSFGFLPNVIVPAELPEGMEAFMNQQFRWCKGGIQTAIKILPRVVRARVPWRIKAEAFAHLCGNLVYPLIGLVAVMLPLALEARIRLDLGWMTWLEPVVFVFGSLSVALFFGASQICREGMGARGVVWVPLAMALGLGLAVRQTQAVFEALWGRVSGFERTPKTGSLGEAAVAVPWRYAVEIPRRAWLEVLVFAWLAMSIVEAVSLGVFRTIPLLVLFGVGFGMTGFGGLKRPVSSAAWAIRRRRAEAA